MPLCENQNPLANVQQILPEINLSMINCISLDNHQRWHK